MPYCPECEAEYREGLSECADCRVALVPALPEPSGSFRWAVVGSFQAPRAQVVAATLAAEGIETRTEGEEIALSVGPYAGVDVTVKVLVREDQLTEARAVLDAGDR